MKKRIEENRIEENRRVVSFENNKFSDEKQEEKSRVI